MDRDVEAFLEMLVAERAAAAHTAAAYRADLDAFAAHLGRADPPSGRRAPRDATAAELASFMGSLRDAGYAARTARRRLSCLRQFFRFLVGNGTRADDPTALLEAPRVGRDLPKHLVEAEIAALLAAASALPPRRARLATAIVAILYATGLRVSELLSLERAPVERLADRAGAGGRIPTLVVRGKGGRERLVPFSDEAIDAARVLAADAPDARYLFSGRDRRRPMTRQGLDRVLADLARAAGIAPGRLTPHALRHSVATHMLARGANLRQIQVLLGHADIATTEIYTHVDATRLAGLVEAHHPLADGARPGRAAPGGSDGGETC